MTSNPAANEPSNAFHSRLNLTQALSVHLAFVIQPSKQLTTIDSVWPTMSKGSARDPTLERPGRIKNSPPRHLNATAIDRSRLAQWPVGTPREQKPSFC